MQVKGINFLIPVNAEINDEDEVQDESIEAELILHKMKSAGNFLNIMILDACRNNPFSRSFRSSSVGLARMNAPKSTLIAYSTAPGSLASDGQGEHSPYTKHLLQNMELPGIPVEQVFKLVRIGLSMETEGEQVSWESSSLMGDFYFSKPRESDKQIYGMLEINIENIDGNILVDNKNISFLKNDVTAFVPVLPGWHSVVQKNKEGVGKIQKVS